MTHAHTPHILTLDQWDELPEDSGSRLELREGILVASPRPALAHTRAVSRLWRQLIAQLPEEFEALVEFEVCIDSRFPPTIRIPDLIVTPTLEEGKRVDARDVVVAVEVLSPGSKRTDLVTKRVEYASAGIEHYWVIDLDEPVTLTAFHNAGVFGYQESPAVRGNYHTQVPSALTIDLDSLPHR